MKSLSEKRLIVNVTINDKEYPFLIDTGASIALIDKYSKKKLGLVEGKKYPGTIVGAGGSMEDVRYCNTFASLNNKLFAQFIMADIENIQDSIKRETGIKIYGIISLPLMKFLGVNIDANSNEITFE